jgi:NAD(P)-dependent dehydrogenase (short-subunit alcohol dehydrogenase family)
MVVLVTGASSGLGKDLVLRLLSEGHIVYAAARRVGRMRELEAAGAVTLKMDITNDLEIVGGVEQIIRDQRRIDVLVNNAAYGQWGAIEDVPMQAVRRQMEVNFIGTARLTQCCLPHMRARKFGKIVNVSSLGGRCAFALSGWYSASKFALEGYSDALRIEVRPFGIDVIVIEPGAMDSEFRAIAAEEARRYSADGAYANLVTAIRTSSAWRRKLPPPGAITDLIVKALKAKRPRARYHSGASGGLILFLKHVLPDRTFDRLIMKLMR